MAIFISATVTANGSGEFLCCRLDLADQRIQVREAGDWHYLPWAGSGARSMKDSLMRPAEIATNVGRAGCVGGGGEREWDKASVGHCRVCGPGIIG